MAKKKVKGTPGAPRKLDLKKDMQRVLDYIEADPRNIQNVKTFVHMCNFLGISTSCFNVHRNKPENKSDAALKATIKKIENKQEAFMIDIGLSGQASSTPWVFCMKNKFGYRDKHEIDSINTNIEILIDQDDSQL